jgi:hypothetical protein
MVEWVDNYRSYLSAGAVAPEGDRTRDIEEILIPIGPSGQCTDQDETQSEIRRLQDSRIGQWCSTYTPYLPPF